MGSVDPAMRYLNLGSSDLKVPIVCLGTSESLRVLLLSSCSHT
jgi:hypothetical protein